MTRQPAKSNLQKQTMLQHQLAGRDITSQLVLDAFATVPREEFVPKKYHDQAYADRPLPIGHNQTISQPYVVAKMCQLAKFNGDEKVLDIGTGSGYQAAILAQCAKKVVTIEHIKALHRKAKSTLDILGYKNITCLFGDGYQGAPKYAPFDVIISAAASKDTPQAWLKQLSTTGRIIMPKQTNFHQELVVITKDGSSTTHGNVAFVPLTSSAVPYK